MRRRRPAVEEEIVADYDVRSPAVRTILTVATTIVAVSALVGLVLGVSILLRDTRVATSQVDLTDATQLVVDATDADLRIVEGQPGSLTISSRVTSGLRKTEYQLGRKGDEIKIVSGCQRWLNPGCGVETTLQVPPGVPLVIRTTSGDITAASVSGGVLTTASTSGDIRATALGVDEFSAETTAGDVGADFAEQPFAFKATTSSGDVRALIPTGDRTYDVMTRTRSGDVDSAVQPDPDGDGFVRVSTGSGDIRITTG